MFQFKVGDKTYKARFQHERIRQRVNTSPAQAKEKPIYEDVPFATVCGITELRNRGNNVIDEVELGGGYSKCNPMDRFDRKLGLQISFGRALSNLTNEFDHATMKKIQSAFRKRNEKTTYQAVQI